MEIKKTKIKYSKGTCSECEFANGYRPCEIEELIITEFECIRFYGKHHFPLVIKIN